MALVVLELSYHCPRIPNMRKPRGYWKYETFWNEAWTYKNRNEFKKGNETAYNTARRNGLLGSMFLVMMVFSLALLAVVI